MAVAEILMTANAVLAESCQPACLMVCWLKMALADADTKATDLMEENNDLRKGMEEILDRFANSNTFRNSRFFWLKPNINFDKLPT